MDLCCILRPICCVTYFSWHFPGNIGAELSYNNVGMFMSSDAGNSWRQVSLKTESHSENQPTGRRQFQTSTLSLEKSQLGLEYRRTFQRFRNWRLTFLIRSILATGHRNLKVLWELKVLGTSGRNAILDWQSCRYSSAKYKISKLLWKHHVQLYVL